MSKNNGLSAIHLFEVLLTVLFIGLKLTDSINWSWLWVLSPLWLPIAVFGGLYVLVCLIERWWVTK